MSGRQGRFVNRPAHLRHHTPPSGHTLAHPRRTVFRLGQRAPYIADGLAYIGHRLPFLGNPLPQLGNAPSPRGARHAPYSGRLDLYRAPFALLGISLAPNGRVLAQSWCRKGATGEVFGGNDSSSLDSLKIQHEGESLAPKILDDRTGKPCDYPRLVEEARKIARARSIEWRPAVEILAEQVNSDHLEAVVRALNRHRRRSEPAAAPRRRRAVSAMALGLGGLLAEIEAQVEEVRGRLNASGRLTGRIFCHGLSRELDPLRELLEERQRALREVSAEQAEASLTRALRAPLPPSLSVARMISTEERAIDVTLLRIREFQSSLESYVGFLDTLRRPTGS